jgi:hypothetical protein
MFSPVTAEVSSMLKGYFFSGIIVTVTARSLLALPFKKILSGFMLANFSTTPNTVR